MQCYDGYTCSFLAEVIASRGRGKGSILPRKFCAKSKLKYCVPGCWPKTHEKSTSRKVLTTEWIEREKLSQSTESDVGSLVNGGSCHMLPEAGTPPMHSYHASAPSP
jgi:hypothetical protein